jgi:2-dehydro-3-deoxyglucarate aldolase/4-hydroxy-2-oxoheptanedioate aldolase
MRVNRFKQLLADGKSPIGHMLYEFTGRGMAQILEAAGVDFVVIDMEHSSLSIGAIADMVAWLKATHVTPFVRIPQVQYHFVARALDAGVMGIVVPNVRGAGEAHALVEAAKYPPLGKRGFYCGGASSDYRMGDVNEFMLDSNSNRTMICMIESPEGLENVEAIAGTPGVDALWVGQWDLSNFMGFPGQFQDPRFRAAVERIIHAARRHNLVTIIQPGDVAQVRQFRELGFDVFSYSADFFVYKDALAQAVANIRMILGE